jgi:predicted ATPase/class 3 adenylate cyclase
VGVGAPTGTVTFLFTDIEGSTRLWDEHPEAMRLALARHDELLRSAIGAHGGYVFQTAGDGMAAAFQRSADAVTAAVDAQRALLAEPWPESAEIRVRMGVHTGEANERDGDYLGPPLNRAARLMAAAHGGQTVISDATAAVLGQLAGIGLIDLGSHRLRGLVEPTRVFGVKADGLDWIDAALATLEVARGNLPTQMSSFVGRSAEMDRLAALVAERRLVTLCGVGGVGKTRLAVQVAAEVSGRFRGGAWLVELGRTRDPGAITAVARAALGVMPSPGRSDLESLTDHLAGADVLLVLDNCEHVLEAAAELAAVVVERCPTTTLLCTSREPLDLVGEQIVPVGPLDPQGAGLALLDDRVHEIDPDTDVLGSERAAALEICRRLDGLPLALELAAARSASMTLKEIASGLDDRFRLLAVGRRRAADRHQTLRATVEWSHQLLGEPARRLFRRLGAFAGGFDVEAARAVSGLPGEGDLDVEMLLGSLVRCSLVQRERSASGTRFRLLETLRTYAQERLGEAGEASMIGQSHAEWVARLVDRPFEAWVTVGSGLTQRLSLELDNWREAVGFALANGRGDLAVRLLTNMGSIDVDEAGPLAMTALGLVGIETVPRFHWLHWTIATRGAIEMNTELLGHVEQFVELCTTAEEQVHAAPFQATLALGTGTGPPLPVIERALAAPGISDQLRAYMKIFKSFYGNLGDAVDLDAARDAVGAARDANMVYVPLAEAFLASALRTAHPDEALEVAQSAIEGDLESIGPFARASVLGISAVALTGVPVRGAAVQLRDRLSQLGPTLTVSDNTFFAVCARILARANHPAAPLVRSFVVNHSVSWSLDNSIVPDLPDAPAPEDLAQLATIVGAALDEVISNETGAGRGES